MKRLSLFIISVLCIIPLSGGFVRAAEPVAPAGDAATDFQNRLDALIAVFRLTESEIRDLQARLAKRERPTEARFALVYDTLNTNLKEYLDLTQSRIEELSSGYITLPGILTTASNLNNWRKTVYDPATQELFGLLLLEQSGQILATVEARYEKVATDVENLQASVAPGKAEAFKTMLQDARQHVENAHLFRDEAQRMFFASFKARHPDLVDALTKLEPAQIVGSAAADSIVAVTSPVAKPKSILDTIDIKKESMQTLMQRVVGEITATYQVFLQMRDLVHQK